MQKLPKIVRRSMSLTLFPASHRILGSYGSGEVVLPRLAVRLEYQVPSTLPVPDVSNQVTNGQFSKLTDTSI
uniref:Putative ovule protein n=1 Tax=Solanum chacoense TaxID=4108 RepID=A0A0V0GZ02_SOLCH